MHVDSVSGLKYDAKYSVSNSELPLLFIITRYLNESTRIKDDPETIYLLPAKNKVTYPIFIISTRNIPK